MPFHFSKTQPSEHISGLDFGLLVIRVITVITLGYYQIFGHLKSAWGYLWEQTDWALVDHIQNLSLPSPPTISVALIFVITLCMLGLLIGIFTRINAFILLLLLGLVLVSQLRLSASLNPQALVLFLGILMALILSGGGKFSLDSLLASRKARAIQRTG